MAQVEQAEALVRDALELINRTGHCLYEVEAHRVLGEVLLARSDPRAGAAAFIKALEIAKAQQAKSWELRAAISYARLLKKQNLRAEAFEILQPIYNWFTEGFDTRDLTDARTFLNNSA